MKFASELMNFISLNTYKASIMLAKEKGEFPLLDRQKFVRSGFIEKHCTNENNALTGEWLSVVEDIIRYGIRNSKMISIAPTGTLSLTFGNNCSSGLEPIFSLEYERKVKMGGQSEENIKIVPLIEITNEMLNYLTITFDGFTPNATNPQFRDNLIKFHIYCPLEQWQLKDFQMRPYKLAAEIDTMFNNKHLTGIGTLEFVGAEQFFMEDVPYGGLCLLYRAIHGGEDQKKMPNPND
jgi:hypothetical protein